MKTKVISAFPGTGKSWAFNNLKDEYTMLDSDSSNFSWIGEEGERHPDFPKNYIKHIKSNIGKVDFIFVSSHAVVREALKKAKIKFILVYPHKNRKEEYIKKYRDRNSSEAFIKLLDENWNEWISECENDKNTDLKRILFADSNLANILESIKLNS